MSAPDILLVSNGFGEAAIAGYLAREIARSAPDAKIEHMPLVGNTQQNQAWHTANVGPLASMPSGGLIAYWNFANLIRDIRAGLVGLTLRQFGFLRRQRKRSVVVAVGDIYCLAACLFFARRPTVFVATAKSQHVAPHSPLEIGIARRASIVFARDRATAQTLLSRGVRAEYAGNLMMDGLEPASTPLPVRDDAIRLGVLPGSRADAATNAGKATRRLRAIARMLKTRGATVQAFISIAPSVAIEAVLEASAAAGINMAPTGTRDGVIARGEEENLEVLAVSGAFGDLLRASQIVLGQAGTGNEQAAGLGRPVVASAESGEHPGRIGWYRMRQQRLLGDALLVVGGDDIEFAASVVALLDDPARRAAMARLGQERMGQPGGAAAVAKAVLAQASQNTV